MLYQFMFRKVWNGRRYSPGVWSANAPSNLALDTGRGLWSNQAKPRGVLFVSSISKPPAEIIKETMAFEPHVPTAETRELVAQLVACDIDHDSICYVIKADPVELRIYYAEQLKFGLAHCTALVQAAVFRAAVAGDMKAARFWLSARAGWRETKADNNVKDVQAAQSKDKQQLIDRIVGLLTPDQALKLVKDEAGHAQPVAQPAVRH